MFLEKNSHIQSHRLTGLEKPKDKWLQDKHFIVRKDKEANHYNYSVSTAGKLLKVPDSLYTKTQAPKYSSAIRPYNIKTHL